MVVVLMLLWAGGWIYLRSTLSQGGGRESLDEMLEIVVRVEELWKS